MSFTIEDLKAEHDKMYVRGQITREKAANDTAFFWATQWDDTSLGESNLGFKGEFNIMRKAYRQIMADLVTNQVQIEYHPTATSPDADADLIDGYHRTISRENASTEAFNNGKQDAVVSGMGAWELFAKYETDKYGSKNQIIGRRPLHEACNNVFWDEGARLQDKSDAKKCSILVPMSKDGMENIAEELTGVVMSSDTSNFGTPEHSYSFPWVSGRDEVFYLVRFYRITKVTDHVLNITGPFGDEFQVLESAVSEILDEMASDGYKVEESKKVERNKVTLYIANGFRILKEYEIPCEYIPVITMYGERAFVEGEEVFEGMTRLCKDPQRLRNFQMSYLADMVSMSPRPKPIFYPEQINKHLHMYEMNGSENNYPFLFVEPKDADGNPFPQGPIGVLPEQIVPTALIQSIALSREAISDVAPANLTQDMADVDLSGAAMQEIQARLDDQSIVYQESFKHASRYDAVVFASMASRVIDSPRPITITKPDGTRATKQIMESIIDKETGNIVVVNDLTGSDFDVFATIGRSYSSKKEETFEKLDKMIERAAMVNPAMAEMLFLKQAQLVEGVNMDDVRDYAHKQSLLKGYIEPDEDDEEEMALVQQAQQSQQPDPNTLLAQAEQAKAEASMADVQRKTQLDQFNAQTNAAKIQVAQFDSETKRIAVQIDAQEANANINFKRIDSLTKRMDSINKSGLRAQVNG